MKEVRATAAGRAGLQVLLLPADLASPTGPARVAAQLADWGIQPGILVNNAGTAGEAPLIHCIALGPSVTIMRGYYICSWCCA